MKTSPKQLGTAHETRTVRACQDAGLVAERIPEGGTKDLGDVRVYAEHEWTLECKDRERLNIHQALEKAQQKAGTPHVAVVWRRMTRKEGNVRRTQDGPIVVAIDLERFLELLEGAES